MPFIGPRMNGDSLCTETLAINRGFNYIGNTPSPCIAQRCNFIDVDAQLSHCHWSNVSNFAQMIARDLINDSFPPLKPTDTGLKAIRWMEEFRLDHLPIVDGTNYIGLISEQDILKLDSLERPLD